MSRAGTLAPPSWPYLAILGAWAAGTLLMTRDGIVIARASQLHGGGLALFGAGLAIVTLAESVGLFYLLGFFAKSAHYLVMPRTPPAPGGGTAMAPVAVLYLTAGDFDPEAVDSLLRLEYAGPRFFLVHDDGDDEVARVRMRELIDHHPCRAGWRVAVWHRPARRGGKAGAVNWVLERLGREWEFLLLCDSDSIALTRCALGAAVPEFQDGRVAAVQFRNSGFATERDPLLQQRLALAIDVFDAFAAPQASWGYLPFFGHNALLRVTELRRLGGLTEGFFSDDLDYSVRLTLAQRRIVYRRDIAFGERHPADWAAFRKRARKWALGCMQVVRSRGGAVLAQRRLPLAHRVGLLEFMGFYPAQAVLLLGLLVRQLALPFAMPIGARDPWYAMLGADVAVMMLAPTLAWALRERRLREWPALAWGCSLVYGGSIVPTVRGVLDGFSRRERPWIPTNLGQRRRTVPWSGWLEMALAAALVGVPWWTRDPVLGFPATYLFVAILLCSPLTFAAYREPGERVRERGASRSADRPIATGVASLLVALLVALPRGADATPLRVHGDQIFLGNSPRPALEIRGVHYSPWLPRTAPDGKSPYPAPDVVDRDLGRIRDLGANAIEVDGAPASVVDAAERRGLLTLYGFNIAWNDTSRAAFDRQADAIVGAVGALRGHPGIGMWILGHEIPAWVPEVLGRAEIERRLNGLATRVKHADPSRPTGHANWPPTKDLDLGSFDVVCFNLYPAWPYEVTVKGFGPYLREVLQPLARGRPLLVTEFGINSLEAGEAHQADVVADCWHEITRSRSAGGVVFEWCDEWWKNFDNPIPGKGYWQREHAPEDAMTHDQDPEEYYGIVGSDRRAKPAFAAVRRMWEPERRSPAPWLTLAGLSILSLWVLRPRRRRARPGPALATLIALCWIWAACPGTANAATWVAVDTLSGTQMDSQSGWTVAGLGDVSGDARGDVGVGIHFYNVGALTGAGAVEVYEGGHVPGAPPAFHIDGLTANEKFGEALAGSRDIDGDGRADLVVGAPLRPVDTLAAAGAVDVFRGGALGSGRWQTLTGEAANDWFGQSVAVGDLDGDGKAEVIVGAPFNDRAGSAAGAVFIYRGGALTNTPWKILTGEFPNDQFGWSVAYVGDVDGDGFGDLVVGARLHAAIAKPAAGRVYLFHGGPTMDTVADGTWSGEAGDDWFGNSVAGPGDVDGGGRPDVLVGAPFNDRNGSAAGAAYLFRGEDPPGSAPAVIYVGESANAQFGWSVSGAGDLDLDGRMDVVVGARQQASGTLAAAGRCYAFRGGASLSAVPWITSDGQAADDWCGNSVSAGIGYYGGTRGALLAGAPFNDFGGSAAGRSYVATTGPVAAVPVTPPLPSGFVVAPNPSRAGVRVSWSAVPGGSREGSVRDVLGRLVRTLPLARDGAGFSVRWDGRDRDGRTLPSGLYLVTPLATRAAGGTAPGAVARVVMTR